MSGEGDDDTHLNIINIQLKTIAINILLAFFFSIFCFRLRIRVGASLLIVLSFFLQLFIYFVFFFVLWFDRSVGSLFFCFEYLTLLFHISDAWVPYAVCDDMNYCYSYCNVRAILGVHGVRCVSNGRPINHKIFIIFFSLHSFLILFYLSFRCFFCFVSSTAFFTSSHSKYEVLIEISDFETLCCLGI